MPDITEAVTLNATTQAGYVGAPIIELDGLLAGGAVGLRVLGGNSTIHGLAVNRFGT